MARMESKFVKKENKWQITMKATKTNNQSEKLPD